MSTPQSGILPESNAHSLFLTLLLRGNASGMERVRAACRVLPSLTAELSAANPDATLSSVLGVGSLGWDRLFPGSRPHHLHPFAALAEGGRSAPATAADLFLHIRSERHDLNFLLARAVMARFGDGVERVEEIAGFRYLDGRDLTGFVDGTENPAGDERGRVALVGADDPTFACGSYVHIQRYVHDLRQWEALAVPEQEGVIGRRKQDDEELDDALKPPTAHIGRVVIEEDGEELEILRHSMPYGDTAAAGLYFVAYGRTPGNFEKMLRRMIHADDDGHFDHLLRYTRAVTGAAFFAPSIEFLAGA